MIVNDIFINVLVDEMHDRIDSSNQTITKHSQPKDSIIDAKKMTNFNQTVEVYSTFKKQEYNRKPDENATFRKLTPQMKVAIREELNTFKKTEMEVHEDSIYLFIPCFIFKVHTILVFIEVFQLRKKRIRISYLFK